jgi:hypothetical protein
VTIARAAAVLALALAILLAAWLLLFRGNGGTEYTLVFENAGHFAYLDHFDRFRLLVGRFLRELDARSESPSV